MMPFDAEAKLISISIISIKRSVNVLSFFKFYIFFYFSLFPDEYIVSVVLLYSLHSCFVQ